MTVTILSKQGAVTAPSARPEGTDLWLSPAEAEAATGWTLKPEGLCRGPVCIPAPPSERDRYVHGDAVNIAAFWRRMDAPAVASDAGDVWVLGEAAGNRAAAMESLEAPDIALPDLSGELHQLAAYRGQKVMLATWASW